MSGLDGLLAKDLVVVSGKGGVGKTTVAAALGLVAAARGQQVVVAEVAARDELARALGARPAGPFVERELAPGLHHVSVDPQRAMEEYLADQLPARALAEVLVRSRLFTYLAAAAPGLRELLTVGKVWELAQPTRRTPGARAYDLVILDAPATGHALALLETPRTLSDAAKVGPLARQGRTIHQMLADPTRTGVVAACAPEELPVSETLALRDELRRRLGLDLNLVVLNGMVPDRFSRAEAAALEPGGAVPPAGALPAERALRLARRQQRRVRDQRAQAARLKRGLAGEVPLATLPFLFSPALGRDELTRLAGRLA